MNYSRLTNYTVNASMKLANTVYILLLAFILISPSAMAGGQCRRLFVEETETLVHNTSDFDQRIFNSYVDVIKDVNSITKNLVRLPTEIDLQLESEGGNSAFHPPDFSISLSHQLSFREELKEPKYSETVLAHEYAHAIFEVNLPFFKEYNTNLRKLKKAQESIDITYDILSEQIESLKTRLSQEKLAVREREILKNKLRVLKAQDEKNGKEMNIVFDQLLNIGDDALHYNEFFADVVAVLYKENPSAIYEAVNFHSHSPKLKKIINTRDFAKNHQTAKWQEKSEHAYFAAARSYFGKKVMSNYRYLQYKGEIIRAVLGAIQAEMTRITAKPALYSDSDLIVQNKRFIKELDSRLNKILQK